MRQLYNPLRGILTKLKIFLRSSGTSSKTLNLHNIIPAPVSIDGKKPLVSLFDTGVYSEWSGALDVVSRISNSIQTRRGILFEKQLEATKASIHIILNIKLEKEGYTLELIEDKIKISASTEIGVLYALYSLVGCMDVSKNSILVPGLLKVSDSPKYAWRGVHIDVARNFFDISVLHELVDLFSFYKLNVFHLHLTDDQGWRFESKKYPRLHTLGSVRKETVIGKHFPFFKSSYMGDKKPVSGYYTQDDLRGLDTYAKERGVEIVPEIDVPGHATAALVAYPQYSAHKPPSEVATYWGVFDNVFSPSAESIRFLCDIFDELASVFSSKYIHVGGDEVPSKKYKKDALTQSMIKNGNIQSFDKVDTYILQKVAEHIVKIGKTPIVWDEGREVALAHRGATMIWRDSKYAKEVLDQGGNIILTPTSHFYFDYYQKNPTTEPLAIGGYLPIEQVYGFTATEATKGNVLGIQANLWTEYIQTSEHLRYMLLPRMYALSEVAWGTNTNLADFTRRLLSQ
jgi:hexosaminidase